MLSKNKDYEKCKALVESLGYIVQPLDLLRKGTILTKDGEEVGSIKAFENVDSFERRNPAGAQFCVEINNDNDSCFVELALYNGDRGYVKIWSSEYGHLSLETSENLFMFKCASNYPDLYVEESVAYRNGVDEPYRNEYRYELSYRKGNNPSTKHFSIKGSPLIRTLEHTRTLRVYEETRKSMTTTKEIESYVDGTVEEMALLHNDGIKAFQRLIDKIKNASPFEEDIIPLVMPEKAIEELGLSIFVSNGEKTIVDALFDKICEFDKEYVEKLETPGNSKYIVNESVIKMDKISRIITQLSYEDKKKLKEKLDEIVPNLENGCTSPIIRATYEEICDIMYDIEESRREKIDSILTKKEKKIGE